MAANKTGKADFATRAPSATLRLLPHPPSCPRRQRRQGTGQYTRISTQRRLAFWLLCHPGATLAESSGLVSFVLRPLSALLARAVSPATPVHLRSTSAESADL